MMQKATKRPKPLWLKIFIGVCLTIMIPVAALLMIDIYFYGFTERRECGLERGFLPKFLCGISETYSEWAPYFRSIPSDEEMMDNFRTHRADFDKLVNLYREDLSVPTDAVGRLLPTPEVEEIMKRIHVSSVQSDGQVWMPPDPYSLQADILKITAEVHAPRDAQARRFSGVFLDCSHHKAKTIRHLGPIHRGYYYTPFSPRMENGLLRTPHGAERILASLNTRPSIDYWGECFCRQIEGQWFIRTCQYK